MKYHSLLLVCGLCVVLVVGCGKNTGWLLKPVSIDETLQETTVARDKGWFISDKIALIEVEGVLLNQRSKSFFGQGENPVSLFVEKLHKAAADQNVKAIVLRVNSPGGAVTAGDIMYRELLKLRKRRSIPVVAVIEDIGASGAYYVACGSDRILAHPTSVVGSIGVIVQTLSIAETLTMIGVRTQAVTSGPHKDMASPLKPLDEKDMAILQGLVDDFYGRFLKVVLTGRKQLTTAKLRTIADGRVYTALQAVDNGLIDGVGYMDDAIALARQMSGTHKAKIVIYHRAFGYKANVYSAATLPPQVNLLNISMPEALGALQPRFMYLWTGGRP